MPNAKKKSALFSSIHKASKPGETGTSDNNALVFSELTHEKISDIIIDRFTAHTDFTNKYRMFVSMPTDLARKRLRICLRNPNNTIVLLNGLGLFFKGGNYRAVLEQDARMQELIKLLDDNGRIGRL